MPCFLPGRRRDASPVALGRPSEDFQFNSDDPLLNPSTTGVNVLTYAEPAAVERSRGTVTIVLANPDGLQADEHPFARTLLRSLQSQGVRLRAVVL